MPQKWAMICEAERPPPEDVSPSLNRRLGINFIYRNTAERNFVPLYELSGSGKDGCGASSLSDIVLAL